MATAKQQQQRRQQTSAALCEFSQSTCVHLSERQFHASDAGQHATWIIHRLQQSRRTLTVAMQPAMVASVCAGGTSMPSDDPLDHHSHYSYYCNCHYSVRRGACLTLYGELTNPQPSSDLTCGQGRCCHPRTPRTAVRMKPRSKRRRTHLLAEVVARTRLVRPSLSR